MFVPSETKAFDKYRDFNQYDPYFKEYSKRYFGPSFEWRYFKSQAIVESRLDPEAESHDGAAGIMQLLSKTFTHVRKENPNIKDDLWNPRWNIAAGIYYDYILWEVWKAERSFEERVRFMFGSYNAGKEAILTAQEIAIDRGLNPLLWNSIVQTLPEVNGGDGSEETIFYVRTIMKVMKELK